VSAAAEPLPDGLVAALGAPAAYPSDPSARGGVEHVQTHISHVFLAAERVYKLRKAVRLSFLDFGTLRARNDDAVAEVRLNRRLAPDVYLGLAPLERSGAGWRVGELGEVPRPEVENAVVMRRLAHGRDALALLAAGALGPAHVRAAAERIATFHRTHALGAPAPYEPKAWRERIDRPMQANLAALREHAGAARLAPVEVERLDVAWREALAARRAALERRRAEGRAVEGHGDLHLAHLWFEAGPEAPLFVDCVEFDVELRRIDAASDVAFLFMDLAYRGRRALGERWLSDYAEARGDAGLYDVVDLYAAYRAAVRAKVAALAAADVEIGAAQRAAAAESAARHLALAGRCLGPPRSGVLVLVAGTVGVGKSTVAAALAEASGAALFSSDRTRKRLAGLPPGARAAADPDAGLYTPAWHDRAYAALLEHAAPALRSGRAVVLDATWSERRRRAAARELAHRLGAAAWLVRVDCAEATALERTRARASHGTDPSDAGPEWVARSRSRFEPPDEWPAAQRLALATDASDWRAALSPLAARLGGEDS
jgi:aminoglycoside phosphotransferase family enzyme/predicted kinase